MDKGNSLHQGKRQKRSICNQDRSEANNGSSKKSSSRLHQCLSFTKANDTASVVPLSFFTNTLQMDLPVPKIMLSCSSKVGDEHRKPDADACQGTADQHQSQLPPMLSTPSANTITCLQSLLAQDQDGDTPLHVLISAEEIEKSLQVISMLSRCHANRSHYNVQNKDGLTALHLAAAVGLATPACLLVTLGASLSTVDKKGNTPIHVACLTKHPDFLDRVIVQGAKKTDSNLRIALMCLNNEGQAPLHLLVTMKNTHSLRIMLHHMEDIDIKDGLSGKSALIIAIEVDDFEQVKLILSNHADVGKTSFNGWTPLHYACCIGNLAIVRELLNYGADPNAKTQEKESSKDVATRTEVIQVLQSKIRKRQRENKLRASQCQ